MLYERQSEKVWNSDLPPQMWSVSPPEIESPSRLLVLIFSVLCRSQKAIT